MSEIKTDTLPFDSPEEIIQLLQSLPDPGVQGVIAAETLQKMSNEPLRLVKSMLPLINHEDRKIVDIMRHYGLQGIFGSISYFLDDQSSESDKKHIIDEILNVSCSPGLDWLMLDTLRFQIFRILKLDKDFKIRSSLLTEIKNNIDHADIGKFRAYLNLVLALLNSSGNPEAIISVFGFLQDKLMPGGYLVETLGVDMAEFSQEPTQTDKLDLINLKLDTLKLFCFVLFEVIHQLKDSDIPHWKPRLLVFQENMVASDFVVVCLGKILGLNLINEKQLSGCLFSTTEIKSIDMNLNLIKSIALKCFSIILSISNKPESTILPNVETNKFLAHKTLLLQGVTFSLFTLCTRYYKEIPERIKVHFTQDQHFGQCVEACIEFVAKITPLKKPDNPFFDNKEHIIMVICLPLLASNQEDLKLLDENPQLFFERTMDFDGEIDDKISLKLKVIHLIRALCENVDGAVSSVAFLLGMLIEYSLILDNPLLVGQQFPKLAPYLQSPVHDIISPRIRVETCLLILTATYDFIVSRPDLMHLLEQTFVRYFDYFMKTPDALIQVRMALFLEVYLSYFFKNDEEMYRKHLFILVDWSAITDSPKDIVANQATSVLHSMLTTEEDLQRITPHLAELAEQIILQIPFKKNPLFFELVNEIIENLDISDLPDLTTELVTRLVERLTNELDQPNRENTLLMNKIWGVIRRIGEKESYESIQEDDIEDILAPLFIRTISEGLDNDEDVISFIQSTTRLTKSVSPLAWEVVNLLPKLLAKYNLNLTIAFNMINQIIVCGHNHINKDKKIIKMLLDIAFEALRTPPKVDPELCLATNALFFHSLIQYINIPKEGFSEMLADCYDKLIEDCHSPYLKARFGGIILLSFLIDFESTQRFFAQMPAKLEYIINFIIAEIAVFNEHMYDQKVYIICLSKFLTQPNLHPIIEKNIPTILDRLVSFLTYIQYVEKVKSQDDKKKSKVKQNEDEDEDDEDQGDSKKLRAFLQKAIDNELPELKKEKSEEEEEEESDKEEEEKENEDQDQDSSDSSIDFDKKNDERSLLNTYVSSLKQKDEYEAFKDAIIFLQQNNFGRLKEYAKNLPQQKKQYLKEMLKTKKILIDEEKGISKTRKILKAVRGKVFDQDAIIA